MEPGNVETPSQGAPKARRFMLSGVLALAAGVILLAAGVAYFSYSWWAHSNLDSLNAQAPMVASQAGDSALSDKRQGLDQGSSKVSSPGSSYDGLTIGPGDAASYALYPGEWISPLFWADPLRAEPPGLVANPLLGEFEPLDFSEVSSITSLLAPTRITIPAIGVDSDVRGLAILDLADSRAYETPKNVVGHIPQTANPGENGTAWFFGHLESPIRGEGSVFSKLPEIPGLWERGVEVYATVESGDTTYLYRLTGSTQVHQDDLAIQDVGGSAIRLVTCVAPVLL